MVPHGMIHRLTEIGRYYGTEINVEKTKVTRISRQLFLSIYYDSSKTTRKYGIFQYWVA